MISAPNWPFTVRVQGDDLVCENIFITCFGGNGDGTCTDRKDEGGTASGLNTRRKPVFGVSIPMDGLQFHGMSPAEHAALDGAPFPRIPWHTPVIVTIDGKSYTPPDGIVDLGPGRHASHPGEPHALDLTVPAASYFADGVPLKKLASDFFKRGSFRVVGGAKFLP